MTLAVNVTVFLHENRFLRNFIFTFLTIFSAITIPHVNSFLRVIRIVISVSDAMYHSADSV